MRLVTYLRDGAQRVGIVRDDRVIDISSVAASMQQLIEGGDALLAEAKKASEAAGAPSIALSDATLLSPIPRPNKNVFCLGLNYSEHVAEGAAARGEQTELPKFPVWFTKTPNSVCGPFDDIAVDPAVSTWNDWEVELAVVIGKGGRHISKEDALSHVHSYSVFNDFSLRDIQRRHGGQFFKGKSADKSSPLGPWLVTADEVADPQNLNIICRVNGDVKQSSNTSMMIFDIATAIADITDVITLEPGDIIATGTPSGVGYARKPPESLKAGDVLESEVEGIGLIRNRIVSV